MSVVSESVRISPFKELYLNYKKWISANPESATTLESTLKWVSWYLTGRLNSANANLLSELVFALSKLLVLFNDRIIHNSIVVSNNATPSENYKYKVWLTVLEYSEVFLELSMFKLYGPSGKWVAILLIQIIKTVARISLLCSKEKLLIEPVQIPPLNRDNIQAIDCNGVPSTSSDIILPSGRVIRSLKNSPKLSERDWKPLSRVVPMTESMRRKLFFTELLYIVKPLLHLGSAYNFGLDAWQPFLLALSIDATCSAVLYQNRSCLLRQDKLEATRRTIMLLMYLLKSPFYEQHTRMRLEKVLLTLCNYRLLKLVCNPLREYIPYWQQTYFYLWSS